VKRSMTIPCLALLVTLATPAVWADAPELTLQTGSKAGDVEGVEMGSFRLDPKAEPDGYQGILWGEDLSKVPGMIKVGVSGASDVYRRENEETTLGLVAKIQKVLYYSYDNKFYTVKIFLEPGAQNWEAFRAAVVAKYGPGYDAGGGNILFVGTTAGLHLRCPPANENSWTLSIFSKALARQAQQADSKAQPPAAQ